MNDTLISFDTAVLAKDMGFNEVCFAAYRKNSETPVKFDNGCVSKY